MRGRALRLAVVLVVSLSTCDDSLDPDLLAGPPPPRRAKNALIRQATSPRNGVPEALPESLGRGMGKEEGVGDLVARAKRFERGLSARAAAAVRPRGRGWQTREGALRRS